MHALQQLQSSMGCSPAPPHCKLLSLRAARSAHTASITVAPSTHMQLAGAVVLVAAAHHHAQRCYATSTAADAPANVPKRAMLIARLRRTTFILIRDPDMFIQTTDLIGSMIRAPPELLVSN